MLSVLRRAAPRSDALALAVAFAVHAGAFALPIGRTTEMAQGPRLLDAPELAMTDLQESEPDVVPEPGTEPEPEAVEVPRPVDEAERDVSPVASDGTARMSDSEQTTEPGNGALRPDDSGGDLRQAKQGATRPGVPSLSSRSLRPRPPRYPPGLAAVVLRNYPHYARRESVEGDVEAHVKLSATGQVLHVRVADVSDDGWGFGEACARSIHQLPEWQPKIDRHGKAVASVASYSCRFVLPVASR